MVVVILTIEEREWGRRRGGGERRRGHNREGVIVSEDRRERGHRRTSDVSLRRRCDDCSFNENKRTTSTRTSPATKLSPSCFFHVAIPPSVMVGDIAGMANLLRAWAGAEVWRAGGGGMNEEGGWVGCRERGHGDRQYAAATSSCVDVVHPRPWVLRMDGRRQIWDPTYRCVSMPAAAERRQRRHDGQRQQFALTQDEAWLEKGRVAGDASKRGSEGQGCACVCITTRGGCVYERCQRSGEVLKCASLASLNRTPSAGFFGGRRGRRGGGLSCETKLYPF